jgi:NAD(P)H-dependent flavin oxidoreductase YrpB (nitropropane dioxygenase family)
VNLPVIIQGGMGMGVSSWRLANTVSRLGQMGVVSGTAIDTIFTRRLQDGDSGGHLRRALKHFPAPEIAEKFLKKYFRPEGRPAGRPYDRIPMFSFDPGPEVFELSVLANFTEVYLAKEGHKNPVGINLLHKIQFPNLSSLYGAMLAGVDCVIMGAGIPRDIPGILDKFARHEPAEMKIPIVGGPAKEEGILRFDPRAIIPGKKPPLKRPFFLGIISSAVLASALALKCESRVDGFIVEGAPAGGHNAPPRGPLSLNARGEPIYGPRDEADLGKIHAIGRPFWLAGACATPKRLAEARAQGAVGVQVGTAFAFCRESAMAEHVKRKVIARVRRGAIDVFTDPNASPTKFPFKVVRLEETMSDLDEYARRERICDLGYLRTAYRRPDGGIGYRCAAELPANYVRKGGAPEEVGGRKCLCNGLLAAIDLAQTQSGSYRELPIVTSGDDLRNIARFLKEGESSYTAQDVINFILQPVEATRP